jgi:hypothetical protein
MAIKGLRGYGALTINANSPLTAQDLAYFPRLNEFTVSNTDEFFVAKAYSDDAIMENVDVVKKSSDAMLSIGMQSFDRNDIEFMLNEFAQTTSSLVLPTVKRGAVPLTAPYTYTDADLIGATVAELQVSILSSGDGLEGGLTVVTTGTPGTGEVDFDDATGVLTFNANVAGKGFRYIAYTTHTNINTIGVEDSPITLDSLSFIGIADGPRFPNGVAIYVPKMDRHTGFEFNISGETNVTIEYKPVLSGSNRKPVQWAFL